MNHFITEAEKVWSRRSVKRQYSNEPLGNYKTPYLHICKLIFIWTIVWGCSATKTLFWLHFKGTVPTPHTVKIQIIIYSPHLSTESQVKFLSPPKMSGAFQKKKKKNHSPLLAWSSGTCTCDPVCSPAPSHCMVKVSPTTVSPEETQPMPSCILTIYW